MGYVSVFIQFILIFISILSFTRAVMDNSDLLKMLDEIEASTQNDDKRTNLIKGVWNDIRVRENNEWSSLDSPILLRILETYQLNSLTTNSALKTMKSDKVKSKVKHIIDIVYAINGDECTTRANNALNRDLLQWKSSIDKSEYDRKHIENIEISYECFKKIPEFKLSEQNCQLIQAIDKQIDENPELSNSNEIRRKYSNVAFIHDAGVQKIKVHDELVNYIRNDQKTEVIDCLEWTLARIKESNNEIQSFVDRDSAIVLRTMKEELSIKWEHKRSSKTRNRILEIWENVLEELSKVYIDIDYKALKEIVHLKPLRRSTTQAKKKTSANANWLSCLPCCGGSAETTTVPMARKAKINSSKVVIPSTPDELKNWWLELMNFLEKSTQFWKCLSGQHEIKPKLLLIIIAADKAVDTISHTDADFLEIRDGQFDRILADIYSLAREQKIYTDDDLMGMTNSIRVYLKQQEFTFPMFYGIVRRMRLITDFKSKHFTKEDFETVLKPAIHAQLDDEHILFVTFSNNMLWISDRAKKLKALTDTYSNLKIKAKTNFIEFLSAAANDVPMIDAWKAMPWTSILAIPNLKLDSDKLSCVKADVKLDACFKLPKAQTIAKTFNRLPIKDYIGDIDPGRDILHPKSEFSILTLIEKTKELQLYELDFIEQRVARRFSLYHEIGRVDQDFIKGISDLDSRLGDMDIIELELKNAIRKRDRKLLEAFPIILNTFREDVQLDQDLKEMQDKISSAMLENINDKDPNHIHRYYRQLETIKLYHDVFPQQSLLNDDGQRKFWLTVTLLSKFKHIPEWLNLFKLQREVMSFLPARTQPIDADSLDF